MSVQAIGEVDGCAVQAVEITSGSHKARLISFGARLTELWVPGRNGLMADIVLGHADLDGYLNHDAYFGATCGRFANRIADGRFTLGRETFSLSRNEGAHHLHGGAQGFDRKVWSIAEQSAEHVCFSALSRDHEMGYPGNCEVRAEYRFTAANTLSITMSAATDAPTPVNMVHHSYFNLAGHASGSVLEQELMISAEAYLPVGPGLIPTGERRDVADTCFDFRKLRRIGAAISDVPGGRGYDHNWCLEDEPSPLHLCAVARDPGSGRGLRLRTTEPGVQLYTGGYLSDAIVGKGDIPMCAHAGFTLESQNFPNAPNEPDFPNSILLPGEDYRHIMEFTFFGE
jgi:aldose 1-epimerase